MGGEQAASVLLTIKKSQMQSDTPEDIEGLKKFKKGILDKYAKEGSAYFSTARLWDDGIIEPKDTRRILARAFEACLHRPIEETKFGVFRM
jgi:3-methylcrotonyl-CoA carboxylase beta subunit